MNHSWAWGYLKETEMESSKGLDIVWEQKGVHSVWNNIVVKIIVQGIAKTTKAQTEHIGHHRPVEIDGQNSAPN